MKIQIQEITITINRREGEAILNALLKLDGENGMRLVSEIKDEFPEAYNFKQILTKNFRSQKFVE